MLLTIGEVAAAERALLEVLRRGDGMEDVASNAMVELMHCASYRRDRGGFERGGGACPSRGGGMPPHILGGFPLKGGIRQGRLGRVGQTGRAMENGFVVAGGGGFHGI